MFERLTQQQRCPTCNRPVHCETTRAHARELCLYEGVLGRVPESFKTKELRRLSWERLYRKKYQLGLSQKLPQKYRLRWTRSETFVFVYPRLRRGVTVAEQPKITRGPAKGPAVRIAG